jgi:hypothetical protein
MASRPLLPDPVAPLTGGFPEVTQGRTRGAAESGPEVGRSQMPSQVCGAWMEAQSHTGHDLTVEVE